jgi:hypothetical protein
MNKKIKLSDQLDTGSQSETYNVVSLLNQKKWF